MKKIVMHYLTNHMPFFNDLNLEEQELIISTAVYHQFPKNANVYSGLEDCAGLYLVKSGSIRAYIVDETGRELNLFRLKKNEVCLFSATCLLGNIDFNIIVDTTAESELIQIPIITYNHLIQNKTVLTHTNLLLSARFNDVIFLIKQLVFSKFDKKLANFLIKEANHSNDLTLQLTAEDIASSLASSKKEVSKMLKYFQNEKLIKLTKANISIINYQDLNDIANL